MRPYSLHGIVRPTGRMPRVQQGVKRTSDGDLHAGAGRSFGRLIKSTFQLLAAQCEVVFGQVEEGVVDDDGAVCIAIAIDINLDKGFHTTADILVADF